jgi:endonuclease/exonuclease/phosphatase family metal-dependent hydrolase
LALDVPAKLRCGDWQVSLERPGTVTQPARQTLHWCPENVLNVLTYNVALVPAVGLPWLQPWLPFPTAVCGLLCWTKDARATALAGHPDLLGYDVLVLQELFSRPHRRAIVDGLARAPVSYDWVSRMVAADWPFAGGGVTILSRWPIEADAVQPFTHCAGGIRDTVEATRNDCLAKKGVVHAVIRKGARRYHVFATHLDAGRGAADRAAREQQLRAIADFVRNQGIPADEPVIIADDLNTERFDPEAERRLGEILRARYGAFTGCSPAPLHPMVVSDNHPDR